MSLFITHLLDGDTFHGYEAHLLTVGIIMDSQEWDRMSGNARYLHMQETRLPVCIKFKRSHKWRSMPKCPDMEDMIIPFDTIQSLTTELIFRLQKHGSGLEVLKSLTTDVPEDHSDSVELVMKERGDE